LNDGLSKTHRHGIAVEDLFIALGAGIILSGIVHYAEERYR